MSFLHTKKQTQSGEYNFNTDPSSGAVGVVRLGVYVPANSIITSFIVNAIDQPAAAPTTLAFGYIAMDDPAPGAVPAAFLTATAVAGFVPNIPFSNINLQVAPVAPGKPIEVLVSIGLAALTKGRVQFWIEYYENMPM